MSDKNFRNIPDMDTVNTDTIQTGRKTTGKDSPEHGGAGLQTYRFEFCSDDKTYSISFGSSLTQENIQKLLDTLHSHLYEDCARIIRMYLEQNHLKYFHFTADETTLDHAAMMDRAKGLLHSLSCDEIDRHIGNADNYYAVADYQKWMHQNRCEGCYYAISRILNSGKHCYHIVAQTFAVGKYDNNPNGYFAIRTNKDNGQLCNIDTKAGEPVLPSFGCVDMMDILINIDSIRTAGQAVQTAVR